MSLWKVLSNSPVLGMKHIHLFISSPLRNATGVATKWAARYENLPEAQVICEARGLCELR